MTPGPVTVAHLATWAIAALATAAVIVRPGRWPEAVWAVGGALALVGAQLLPWREALQAVGKGLDVYLFLAGMMLISELARREGLFDFLAARAVHHARGSAPRLFFGIYAIGVVVTVFMSNDATAVVLTPAVYAAAKKAGARPLPYLLACAFIANAASFVLPISNPANLVIFGEHLPPLGAWFGQFALASVASIGVTYAVLRWLQRDALAAPIAQDIAQPVLSPAGRWAGAGIASVAVVLVATSALGGPLGAATLGASALACAGVLLRERSAPWALLRGVSWSVLALVAGLFVLVEGLVHSGLIPLLSHALREATTASPTGTAFGSGALVAVLCNLMNNLPAGLMAGSVLASADATPLVRSAVAIGIDLGPNLSLTGSLATLLWLVAIRREGENVTAWQFLRVGAVAMPLALAAALGALYLQHRLWG
ncbi:arsenic transporter [Variovorax sp. LT1R16]|uniref:arsenic transporter n=1 Tax=Variovorax sp. LT1R16 TaxID=3443728 RepID=UPI003F4481F0